MNPRGHLARIAAALPGLTFSLKVSPGGDVSMPFASSIPGFFDVAHDETTDGFSHILRLLPREDVDEFQERIRTCARRMKPWGFEFRFLHPERGELWAEVHSSPPVLEPDGSILWHGFMHDITDRKGFEQQIQLAASALDMLPEAVLVTDTRGRILTVNQAFSEMMGYRREDVIGKRPTFLQSARHNEHFYREMWATLTDTGQWQGEIWNRHRNGEISLGWLSVSSVRDSRGKPWRYIGLLRATTFATESQNRMEYLIKHDDLTSLPNRALLNDYLRLALARAGRNLSRLGVLMVDLDNFKGINDTLGHDLGDSLLVQAARRLVDSVRAEDTVARLGGDEFALIIEEADGDIADQAAERILTNLAKGYWIEGNEYFISASIGISLYPDDATDATALMRHADTAMYRAKAQGKNNYRFFSEDMGNSVRRRLTIETDLRKAIRDSELCVEYQPQVELVTARLVGCEALVRWNRNGTRVLPDEFISVAEESDLIILLDEWVLTEACRQMLAWEKVGLSDFTVSVNISGRHFRQLDMLGRITGIIQAHGISSERLCLEITEGSLMDKDLAGLVINDLRESGFRISLDDFGTGYSSLSYLRKFKIHELKIDKAFVDGILDEMDDRSIILAIIALAKSLGMMVVAEGVEEEDQQAMLLSYGCDIGQGYFYSRPVGADAFADWALALKAAPENYTAFSKALKE